MIARDPDIAAMLGRALGESARAAGVEAMATDSRARPWFSATFAGERVCLGVRCRGRAVAAWLDALPEADLPMRGWFVADLAVESRVGESVTVEALVVRAS